MASICKMWVQDEPVVALVVVTLILGAFLRIYHLDSKSLWYDEIVTAVISDKDNDLATVLGYALRRIQNIELGHVSPETPAKPPLYFVITRLFLQFGSSDFVMRLPAALLGILGIAAIYLAGTILFGKRERMLSAFLRRCHYGLRVPPLARSPPRNHNTTLGPIDLTHQFIASVRSVRRVPSHVGEVYGFFNDRYGGHAPRTVNLLKEILGLSPVDPRSIWPPQLSMFGE